MTIIEAVKILRNPAETKQRGMEALAVAVTCLFTRESEIRRMEARFSPHQMSAEDLERWFKALESYPQGKQL